jgi:hypothetical protein
MRRPALLSSLCVAAALGLGSAPRTARAGDDVAADAAARLAAATLEAANLRAKAKLEEAHLLEKAGDLAGALAATREAERIQAEALATARAAVPERRLESTTRTPTLRIGPGRAPLAPAPTPVPAAAAFLRGTQADDGLFGPTAAGPDGTSGEGNRHADARVVATCWTVLALLDAAQGDDLSDDARRASRFSARRAATALSQRVSSPSEDAEVRALVAWALAAASAHGAIEDPAEARRATRAAVLRVLSDQRADGSWRAGTGEPAGAEADLLATTWACGALHEARALPALQSFDEATSSALEAAGAFAARLPAEAVATPAARVAAALLGRNAPSAEVGAVARVAPVREPALPAATEAATDPAALLLGSVAAFHAHDGVRFDAWSREVLDGLVPRQAVDGAGAGRLAFDDARSRRLGADLAPIYGTALAVLAWHADLPFAEPVSR